MLPTFHNFHNSFKINGAHFDQESLFDLAYSYAKEGSDYEKEIGTFILDWLDASETIQLSTSGTTGHPKTIILSKQAMVYSAIATADYFKLQPGNSALLCLPARYIAGKMMLVRTFIIGLELDILPSRSNLEALSSEKIYDFVALVPLQAQNSLDKLSQFKKIIIGGASVSSELSLKLQYLNNEIYETYGMTETISHIAAKRIGSEIFSVLPNVTIASDDRDCLVVNIPFISVNTIITNDIVEIISPTTFKWKGRYDHVINSGGIKLFPEQIEAKIATHLTVPFLITGIPDALLGQKVILVLEGSEFKLPKSLFEKLDKYEIPKDIFFVTQFERTATSKINIKKTLLSIGL
jgi:O-succinylbenzoic acid--CoA ligase